LNLSGFCLDSEMLTPIVAAWVEQPDRALCLLINRGNGIGLVQVAGAARQSQIVAA
jgi:hypothetical protein